MKCVQPLCGFIEEADTMCHEPSFFCVAPGVCYPVGIVPPRTKSPMMDSSSIGSYVTLRKSRRPESRNVSRETVQTGKLVIISGGQY